MKQNAQKPPQPSEKQHVKDRTDHVPYYRRMHHSPIFWVFLFLMFVAILYYIVSVNFMFTPA